MTTWEWRGHGSGAGVSLRPSKMRREGDTFCLSRKWGGHGHQENTGDGVRKSSFCSSKCLVPWLVPVSHLRVLRYYEFLRDTEKNANLDAKRSSRNEESGDLGKSLYEFSLCNAKTFISKVFSCERLELCGLIGRIDAVVSQLCSLGFAQLKKKKKKKKQKKKPNILWLVRFAIQNLEMSVCA